MNKKKWIVIGGAASAFALAPVAAAAGPSLFDQPMSGSGVVVAAATAGPSAEAADPTATGTPDGTNTVTPASPQTPGETVTPTSPVTPPTQASPPSPVTPNTPASAKSPVSPQTPN